MCICIVFRMFRSVGEAVLTMRKLFAEILCLNFFAWFLGSECDGLVSARGDLSDVLVLGVRNVRQVLAEETAPVRNRG